jgi:uncharacterized coiled-coil protein SlyX
MFTLGTSRASCDDVESGHDGRSARNDMPTLEERIANLEGRMTPDLREEMQRGFAETRQEFTAIRVEMARGFQRMDDRFQRLDDRMHRQFTWLVGIQLTMMVTMIGVLAAAFFRTV